MIEVGDIIKLVARNEYGDINDTYGWCDTLYMVGWVSESGSIMRYHRLDNDRSWYTSIEYVVLVTKRSQYMRDSILNEWGV